MGLITLITKEDKKAVIEHYNRMIAWAETQTPFRCISLLSMGEGIGETWHTGDCPLCVKFFNDCCHGCPLSETLQNCNVHSSFWALMDSSGSWEEWICYAEKLRDYVARLPEVEE